jgi:hypothetical protein
MAAIRGADGTCSAGVRRGGGLRLAAMLLTIGAEGMTFIGLLALVGRLLFPLSLPSGVTGLVALTALVLVPGVVLGALAGGLALLSRAGRVVVVCALGTLAVGVVSIAAGAYLYHDYSLRQRLATWQCRPGLQLTLSCRFPDRPESVQDATSFEEVRLAVAQRIDPAAFGIVRVTASPPDKIVVALDRRHMRHDQEALDGFVRFVVRRGLLEFRILPTTDRQELGAAEIERYTRTLTEKGPEAASDDQYRWVEIRNIADWHSPYSVVGKFRYEDYVLASNRPEEVMLHGSRDSAWRLKEACATDDEMGRRAIGFTLDQRGGDLFWELTGRNGGRPLAILLDNVAISAPTIDPDVPIRDKVIIRGNFAPTEVEDMVTILSNDPLPFELHLEETVWQD